MVAGIKGYDKTINLEQLMALPFEEGTGLITQDVAKPHHPIIMSVVPPTWVALANDRGMLSFNGAANYLYSLAADTADLNFTSGDYSIAGWINWSVSALSQIVIGRYGVDLDGWELYLTDWLGVSLTLRHHHGSLAPVRTGCYSVEWTPDIWCFMGVTRAGAYPKMYRNGRPVGVTYDVGGLNDPDTCNRDLVMGCRYTKNTNWYSGRMWNMRVWGSELSAQDMRFIFETERHLFGV